MPCGGSMDGSRWIMGSSEKINIKMDMNQKRNLLNQGLNFTGLLKCVIVQNGLAQDKPVKLYRKNKNKNINLILPYT